MGVLPQASLPQHLLEAKASSTPSPRGREVWKGSVNSSLSLFPQDMGHLGNRISELALILLRT